MNLFDSFPHRLFLIACLSLYNISQYISKFTVQPLGRYSSKNTSSESQNKVKMTFPANSVHLNFFGVLSPGWICIIDCHFISGVKWFAQLSSLVTIQDKNSPVASWYYVNNVNTAPICWHPLHTNFTILEHIVDYDVNYTCEICKQCFLASGVYGYLAPIYGSGLSLLAFKPECRVRCNFINILQYW